MTALPLLTTLSLPAVTTFPSVHSLQWTADGQVILLTSSSVFVLVSYDLLDYASFSLMLLTQTPDPGISVENSSVIKQPLDEIRMKMGSHKPVGWLRTMIEWGKTSEMFPWAAECAGIRCTLELYQYH